MTEINVLLLTPNFNDSSSWWRGVHPFTRMKRHGYPVNIITAHSQDADHALCDSSDVMFLQRPQGPHDIETIRKARESGIPVWVDYDDDYVTIQPDNPNYGFYKKPIVQEAFLSAIKSADVVSASTMHLCQKMIEYGAKKAVLLPNTIDSELLGKDRQLPRLLLKDDKKLCCWRGSNTHVEDLRMVQKEAIDLISEYQEKDWIFAFLGWKPYFITEHVKDPEKLIHIVEPNVWRYMKMLPRLKTQLFWVSLVDNDFNRSKSNIAYQEAALSGSCTVAPFLPEWEQPGIANYKTPNEFYLIMKSILDRNDHKELGEISYSGVCEKFNLRRSNEIRWRIIESLV